MKFLVLIVFLYSLLSIRTAESAGYNCFHFDSKTKEITQMSVDIQLQAQPVIIPLQENFQIMNAIQEVDGVVEVVVDQTIEKPVLWGLFKRNENQKMVLKFSSEVLLNSPNVKMRRILYDQKGHLIESRPFQCGRVSYAFKDYFKGGLLSTGTVITHS